jgi:hypothetical protein
MGRHRLSQPIQRGLAEVDRPGQPGSPQEAQGQADAARTAHANAAKSTVRARIEHVFARQKDQMGLFVRTIGIARAEAKITLANLAYNIDRLIFHEPRAAMG